MKYSWFFEWSFLRYTAFLFRYLLFGKAANRPSQGGLAFLEYVV
jgi:hypothetical protein